MAHPLCFCLRQRRGVVIATLCDPSRQIDNFVCGPLFDMPDLMVFRVLIQKFS